MGLREILLGLLSLQPMSGYDLNRAFRNSVAHFWHADQSQIYRTLDRLAADGSIDTERIRQQRQPDRKVHSLTDAGRQELETWLASPLEPERFKEPFLARLFFADSLGPEGVEHLLSERQDSIERFITELENIHVPNNEWAPMLRESTRRYGLAQANAELEWLIQTRQLNDQYRSHHDSPKQRESQSPEN